MNKWSKTCNLFEKVREMLQEDIETTRHCMKIMYTMEACCDELTPNDARDWLFYDDFRDLKADIHDEIECMDECDYETCEHVVNNYLSEMYDLCDIAGVWLAV